jgi:hypothetical protein
MRIDSRRIFGVPAAGRRGGRQRKEQKVRNLNVIETNPARLEVAAEEIIGAFAATCVNFGRGSVDQIAI